MAKQTVQLRLKTDESRLIVEHTADKKAGKVISRSIDLLNRKEGENDIRSYSLADFDKLPEQLVSVELTLSDSSEDAELESEE